MALLHLAVCERNLVLYESVFMKENKYDSSVTLILNKS